MQNILINHQSVFARFVSATINRLSVIARLLVITALFGILSGCEQSMSISDGELLERIEECLSDSLTPGMAVACGNYQKECKRRGKATGNYIC